MMDLVFPTPIFVVVSSSNTSNNSNSSRTNNNNNNNFFKGRQIWLSHPLQGTDDCSATSSS